MKKISVLRTCLDYWASLPGMVPYKGHYVITGTVGNMVLVNSDFGMQNIFSKNHPQSRHMLSKFSIPFLG
jgi:hypothetical protein